MRLHAHDAIPFAIGNTGVVFVCKVNDVAISLTCLFGCCHGFVAHAVFSLVETLAGADGLEVHVVGCLNRILHHLIIGILQVAGDVALESVNLLGQRLIVGDALVLLSGGVAYGMHVLRFACRSQTIVFALDGSKVVGILFAKGAGSPVAAVTGSLVRTPAVDIPGKIHAELGLLLSRFNVADINHPQRANALVVSLRKLKADERG